MTASWFFVVFGSVMALLNLIFVIIDFSAEKKGKKRSRAIMIAQIITGLLAAIGFFLFGDSTFWKILAVSWIVLIVIDVRDYRKTAQ